MQAWPAGGGGGEVDAAWCVVVGVGVTSGAADEQDADAGVGGAAGEFGAEGGVQAAGSNRRQ